MLDLTLVIIRSIQDKIDIKLQDELTIIGKNTINVNLILIAVLFLLMVLFWKMFILNFEGRILRAKLMLQLFPRDLIITNTSVKRFLNKTCKNILIN